MADERPETIGRYEIRQELGRGMMGVVYEAYDPSLHRLVALKIVRLLFAITEADKEAFERRFLSEARIAARLSHPGIVVVHDIGRDSETGILYIALERLQGRTLAEMTAEGARLPWRDALEITARVAEALAYAHAQGVVHRDIKPANVMVLPTGEPKIMDFGLAKHEAGHDLTVAGQFIGTPLFMAPEQVLGQKVDGRTDLFSLGSVLHTLLTGTRAFAADSVPRIMNRVAHQEPQPVTEACPDLPPVLGKVLLRAMAKDRSYRYPTGDAFAEDLEDALAGRAPRHLEGWSPPSLGEGTMVSAREGEVDPVEVRRALPELDEPLLTLPPPSRRRRRLPVRALALALFLAGLATYFFSSESSEKLADAVGPLLAGYLAPPPSSLPESPSSITPPASPAAAADSPLPEGPPVEPSPLDAGEPDDALGVPTAESPANGESTAVAPPTPEAIPSPPTTAAPAPAPDVTPTPSPAAPPTPRAMAAPRAAPKPQPSPDADKAKPPARPATLTVHMEHHLKSGTVRVWLDNRLVVEEALDARVTRKVLFLTVRKGLVEEKLNVTPGRRELRVQVKWDDNVEMKRLVGSFRAGTERQLEIRISRLGGDLSLEWK